MLCVRFVADPLEHGLEEVAQVRRRQVLLVWSLLTVMLVSGCVPPEPRKAQSKIVYGLTLAPSGIDPHVDVSSELGIPLSSVYDPLVFRTDDGRFVPGLAEWWEVSDDGRVYTFRLRRGIKFHDGTEFDAAAVKRTLDRVVDPETRSLKAVLLLGPYQSCEVVDSHTVQIILEEPFAPLLDSLSQVYLAPASPEALDKWGEEYQFHQVGTGPYMMREYVAKDRLILVRNPDYALDAEVYRKEGPAAVEVIEFRFLVEPAVRSLALEAGDADVVGEIPPQDAARIESAEGLALVPVAIPGLPLVAFLNSARPPTDDLRVRRALILATDREEIARVVFGGYSPVADGPLSHSHADYDSRVESLHLAYDPGAAVALLEEAGWVLDGDSPVRVREGERLQIEAYVMGWGLVPEVSQLLQAQWSAVGVDLVLNQVTFAAAMAAVGENRHNLFFWSEPGTDADLLRSFFHSENIGLRNWSGASLPELDRILDEARRERDPVARGEAYGRAQTIIMEQALIVPIRDYVNLNGVRDCVQGLRFDSRGWFPILHDLAVAGSCR